MEQDVKKKMKESIERAFREKRLRFFSNGKYSYQPSKEYLAKFKGEKAVVKSDPYLPSLKAVAFRLNKLVLAFEVAERRGQRVSHVTGNVIRFAG